MVTFSAHFDSLTKLQVHRAEMSSAHVSSEFVPSQVPPSQFPCNGSTLCSCNDCVSFANYVLSTPDALPITYNQAGMLSPPPAESDVYHRHNDHGMPVDRLITPSSSGQGSTIWSPVALELQHTSIGSDVPVAQLSPVSENSTILASDATVTAKKAASRPFVNGKSSGS